MERDLASEIAGQVRAFYNEFEANRLGRVRPIDLKTFDLSTARTDVFVNVAGDMLWADLESTGLVKVKRNHDQAPAIPFKANSTIHGQPFKGIYITNTAQSGKILNLWYGLGERITPPNQDITSIQSISTLDLVSAITPPSIRTTPYFRYSVSSALNTIVAPAANTAGVRVGRGLIGHVSSTMWMRLMMKASAPATYDDAAAITLSAIRTTSPNLERSWESEFIVPAGYGLYEQSNEAINPSYAQLGYTVL